MGASGGTASSASSGGDLLLGRYQVLERLGAGGFGVVWHALDRRLERHVALKEVRDDAGAGPTERALREARAAAALNHPGIVALYEVGRDSESIYLVYELVVGHTLADLFRRDALSDADLARIGTGISDALEHAHRRGIVHRDVKPHNVMVVAEPERIARRERQGAGWAKLTDFGIAHLALGEGITAPGEVLGSLAYMAPEQAEGREVSGATDVYALALTLYEGFTGENPRRMAGPLAAHRSRRPPPPLRSRRRDLPAALGSVIDRALDPRPARRPLPNELSEVLAQAVPMLDEDPELTQALAVPPRAAGAWGATNHAASPWDDLDSSRAQPAAKGVDPGFHAGRPSGQDSHPSGLPTRDGGTPRSDGADGPRRRAEAWSEAAGARELRGDEPNGHESGLALEDQPAPMRPDPDLLTRHDPPPPGVRDDSRMQPRRGPARRWRDARRRPAAPESPRERWRPGGERGGEPAWHARAGAAPRHSMRTGEWEDRARGAEDAAPGARARWALARLSAAACAGAAVLLVLGGLASDVAPTDTYLVAAAAAAGVALLPRLGFLAVLAAGLIWLGLGPAGLPGAALVLALAALAAPCLIPRAGPLWPLPVLAAALVIPGLPAAYLGIASFGGSAWRRAALGAAGALATAAMVALARVGPEGWIWPRGLRWRNDPADALDRVVLPALEAGLPLLALGWAGLALLLPVLLRAGRATARLTGAAVWCALAMGVHGGVASMIDPGTAAEAAAAALPGAALGAAIALVAAARRTARGAGRDGERL